MTATPSNQPAGPDDLATRLARIGLPSGGVKDRLAVLPGPLRELHRRLLGAFLTEASPPASAAEVAGMAAELDLDPQAALATLAAADAVHADPASGRPIAVEVRGGAWRFEPATTVVLAATATGRDARGTSADCCCPDVNFHVDPSSAEAYLQAHSGLAAELFDQAETMETTKRIFGRLLDPDHDHHPDPQG